MIRYITTAIPYVNAKPHIGHAIEYIQADALLRYFRAQGETVYGLYGTDDNSLKNVRAAQAAGEETEAYVARHAAVFRELKGLLNLTFDGFIRTRDAQHMQGAQKLWSMFNSEDIYKKSYSGNYCVGCETFYSDEEAPGGLCIVHKKPLEQVEEENYFFKLSNYQERLEQLLESDTLRITPASRKNEMLAFVRQGLQDFSISRSVERAEHWGVPVPGDASQVMYVWVDALSNYITALGFDEGDAYKTFWCEADQRLHIVGKDITRFHVVYWPAFLLSAGVPLPTEVFAHGFFTVNGEKMSKSLGNVLDPIELVADFGVDALRYAFLRSLPYGDDGDISLEKLEARYADLANGLGNLVSRVSAMAGKYFDGALDVAVFVGDDKRADELITAYDFKAYIEHVWSVVDAANVKIDQEAPFKTAKTDLPAAKKTLSETAAMIRWIATKLAPIIPAASEEIIRRYAYAMILHGDPLFPRRDKPTFDVAATSNVA